MFCPSETTYRFLRLGHLGTHLTQRRQEEHEAGTASLFQALESLAAAVNTPVCQQHRPQTLYIIRLYCSVRQERADLQW